MEGWANSQRDDGGLWLASGGTIFFLLFLNREVEFCSIGLTAA
jgi:hypothetical protein